MAQKKPASPAVYAERLADSVSQCSVAIDDLRRRLGDAERRLDELRHLPLTTLAIREEVAVLREAAKPRSFWAWLSGR